MVFCFYVVNACRLWADLQGSVERHKTDLQYKKLHKDIQDLLGRLWCAGLDTFYACNYRCCGYLCAYYFYDSACCEKVHKIQTLYRQQRGSYRRNI